MIELTDRMVVPLLAFLAESSIRWGLILVVLAVWLAALPPRRAEIRHLLCMVGLAAGLFLPMTPRWGNLMMPWPVSRQETAGPLSFQLAPQSVSFPSGPASRMWIASRRGHEAETQTDRGSPVSPPSGAIGTMSARAALGAWRVAAWIVALVWTAAVIFLLLRMLLGRALLARLRQQALAVGPDSCRLLEDCRRTLRVSRTVALAAHPAVASPVALGGLHCLVLVPVDWNSWPEPQRRWCLLHELAHLAQRDDWSKLLEELIRIPYFFHPLVRWLLARLDRERELLCDESVVRLGSDRIAYARLLRDLARQPYRLCVSGSTLHPGWISFLDRSTVAVRIERLLADDMSYALCPFSRHRLCVFGTLFLAAALGAGSLRIGAGEPRKMSKDQSPEPAVTKETSARPEARTIKGVVLDNQGKRLAGAVVVAGIADTGMNNHRVFTTDNEGLFSWPIPASGGLTIYLCAHKEGWAAASQVRWLGPEKTEDSLELRLGKPELFSAALIGDNKQPITGARVRVEMSARAREFDSAGREQIGGGGAIETTLAYYYRGILKGSPLEPLFVSTTDEHGAFVFHSLQPNSWLRLAVTTRDGQEMHVKRQFKTVGRIDEMMEEWNFVAIAPGQETQLTIFPAARVEGRVTTRLPGVSVRGIRVRGQASQVRKDPWSPRANSTGIGQTDAEGRFVFDGLFEGAINIWPMEDKDEAPWTYRLAENILLKPGMSTAATIELIRGVEVAGSVIAQRTGRPVAGAVIGVYGPHYPRFGATRDLKTDAQGRFHLRLPEGKTSFFVVDNSSGYARVPDKETHVAVTIPVGVRQFELPPFSVKEAH
jgi:beta-lactamase regulating signal transducer with metallopeptidase domain